MSRTRVKPAGDRSCGLAQGVVERQVESKTPTRVCDDHAGVYRSYIDASIGVGCICRCIA